MGFAHGNTNIVENDNLDYLYSLIERVEEGVSDKYLVVGTVRDLLEELGRELDEARDAHTLIAHILERRANLLREVRFSLLERWDIDSPPKIWEVWYDLATALGLPGDDSKFVYEYAYRLVDYIPVTDAIAKGTECLEMTLLGVAAMLRREAGVEHD